MRMASSTRPTILSGAIVVATGEGGGSGRQFRAEPSSVILIWALVDHF